MCAEGLGLPGQAALLAGTVACRQVVRWGPPAGGALGGGQPSCHEPIHPQFRQYAGEAAVADFAMKFARLWRIRREGGKSAKRGLPDPSGESEGNREVENRRGVVRGVEIVVEHVQGNPRLASFLLPIGVTAHPGKALAPGPLELRGAES